jgi:glutaredoxin
MTVSETMILYSRADCHLCDVAAGMLERSGARWRTADIDADPALLEKYGVHVPVIADPESGRELFFPFSDEELARFLAEAV